MGGKMNQGWECPRCGQINAPFKATCDCKPMPRIQGVVWQGDLPNTMKCNRCGRALQPWEVCKCNYMPNITNPQNKE